MVQVAGGVGKLHGENNLETDARLWCVREQTVCCPQRWRANAATAEQKVAANKIAFLYKNLDKAFKEMA